MLDWSLAGTVSNGIAFVRDDRDPFVYYALPPRPGVALTDAGAPRVRLLRFVQGGALIGGDLSLAVDLAYPQGALEEAGRLLRESLREERIVVFVATVVGAAADILFVGREADSEGGLGPLVHRVYARTTPGLDPPHAATLSATLSPDGVRLFEAALRSGGAPIGVAFRLQIEGLRPAHRVVVRVDWGRVYEHLSAHARTGALVLVEDVARLSERLVSSRDIQIDVVQGLAPDGGDEAPGSAAIDAAVAWLQREIVERFCEPVLPLAREPAAASLGAIGELLGVGASFAVKALTQVERGTVQVDLQAAAVATRTLVAQAHLADLLAGASPEAHIEDVGADHPFFARVAVHLTTARPLADCHVRELIADFNYGASRIPLRLAPDAPEARAETWADASRERRWTLALSATLADDAPVDPGQTRSLPTLSGDEREVSLDLERLLGLFSVDVVASPDERLLATRVTLRHARGDDTLAERELLLRPGEPRQTAWFLGHVPGDSIDASPQHLLSDGRRVDGAPLRVETRVFRLPPPFPGAMTVQLFAQDDWTGLERVVVQIQKREDQPAGTFAFARPGESLAVSLDLPDPTDRTFRYQTTRTWSDGRVEEDAWVTTDVAAVLVGRTAADKLVVDLRPVGVELPVAGVLLVEVELAYIDARNQLRDIQTFVIRALADRPRWEVALRDPTLKHYEYRITTFRTSGERQVGPWTRTAEQLLLVPIAPSHP